MPTSVGTTNNTSNGQWGIYTFATGEDASQAIDPSLVAASAATAEGNTNAGNSTTLNDEEQQLAKDMAVLNKILSHFSVDLTGAIESEITGMTNTLQNDEAQQQTDKSTLKNDQSTLASNQKTIAQNKSAIKKLQSDAKANPADVASDDAQITALQTSNTTLAASNTTLASTTLHADKAAISQDGKNIKSAQTSLNTWQTALNTWETQGTVSPAIMQQLEAGSYGQKLTALYNKYMQALSKVQNDELAIAQTTGGSSDSFVASIFSSLQNNLQTLTTGVNNLSLPSNAPTAATNALADAKTQIITMTTAQNNIESDLQVIGNPNSTAQQVQQAQTNLSKQISTYSNANSALNNDLNVMQQNVPSLMPQITSLQASSATIAVVVSMAQLLSINAGFSQASQALSSLVLPADAPAGARSALSSSQSHLKTMLSLLPNIQENLATIASQASTPAQKAAAQKELNQEMSQYGASEQSLIASLHSLAGFVPGLSSAINNVLQLFGTANNTLQSLLPLTSPATGS